MEPQIRLFSGLLVLQRLAEADALAVMAAAEQILRLLASRASKSVRLVRLWHWRRLFARRFAGRLRRPRLPLKE
jgi:hypothetical protein